MSHFKKINIRGGTEHVPWLLCEVALLFSIFSAGCTAISDPGPWDSVHDPASENFVPAAPTVFLEETSSNAIIVHWVRNSRFDINCDIYRKKPGGAYMKLGSRPADSLSFVDSLDLDTSLHYFYKVGSSSANGVPTYSEDVEFIPGQKLGVPVLVTVKKMSGGSWVYVEWSYDSWVGNEFVIERAHNDGSFSEIGRTSISIRTFADNWPEQTGTSSYRLRVIAKGKMSAYSNIMTL